jgi:hypothetical protein
MNDHPPEFDQITNVLYAVVESKFHGAVRLTKKELEYLPDNLSLHNHVDKDTGDLFISTVQNDGKPN